MKTVLFISHVKSRQLYRDVSFYEQDIRAIGEAGYRVIVSNNLLDALRLRYDFIFIWWWSFALPLLLIAKARRIKSIVTGAFHYRTPKTSGGDYLRKGVIYRTVVSWSLRLANSNVFVSQFEFDEVVENLQVRAPRLVHHGIDTDLYTPTGRKNSSPGSPIQILMISWLETSNIERKCVLPAIAAVCRLRRAGMRIELTVAGRAGRGFNEFKAQVDSLEGSSCVKFIGHVTEARKIELLQRADIFLSPTLYEGFGVAIAEAMACGCAVVTSPEGAVPEVAGDGAVYCDGRSVDSIAACLIDLVQDGDKRQRLAELGSARVASRFSYRNHFLALSKVLGEVFR